jgi:2,4-dienoyl-CoA reductase-like NADH-dependent reductase (Old Yellow Enzyme family)
MTSEKLLFSPYGIGPLSLRNRVVMAPMTRERAAGGVPTREMADYYRRRAAGGVGLIITEGAPPDLTGSFGSTVPRFYGEDALDGWSVIVDAAHAEGAALFAQLWHVGAFNPSLIGMVDSFEAGPVRQSPSGLAGPGVPFGKAMDRAAIDAAIDAYAAGASAAQALGFDGVEIHGAHGYLPDQFFWKQTNTRTDHYGGSIANRARFAAEIVQECRRRCGPRFPISFRFSQWKQLDYSARIADTPEELAALLEPLTDAGVTMLHVSTRRFWEPAFADSPLSLAAWTKKLTAVPVIAVGSVTLGNDFKSAQGKVLAEPDVSQLELLERSLERGDFDLIAIGRALLANPDWVRIVREGRPHDLRPFSKEMIEELV